MMGETQGFFGKLYRRLDNTLDRIRPVARSSIGKSRAPNFTGSLLELVSMGRLAGMSLLKKLKLDDATLEYKISSWEKHEKTYEEANWGLVTEIGKFGFTYAGTVATTEQLEQKARHAILHAEEGWQERYASLKGASPLTAQEMQNRFASEYIYARLIKLRKEGESTQLQTCPKIDYPTDQNGEISGLNVDFERRGWPVMVRAAIYDNNNVLIGYRNFKFRRSPTNNLAMVDWNSVIRGGDDPYRKGSQPEGYPIESSEFYFLDEWHDENGQDPPDVIIGLDRKDQRIDNLTHDRRGILFVGFGDVEDRTFTLRFGSPTHITNTGLDLAGSKPTSRRPDAPWSALEKTLSSDEIRDYLDNSKEAQPLNRIILDHLGEFEAKFAELNSELMKALGENEFDDGFVKESLLASGQLMENPVMAELAARSGIYAINKNFEVPPILLNEMIDIPELEYWKSKGIIGVVIPALAAAMTIDGTVGLDMALKNNDMTLAPMGLEIFEQVRAALDRMERSISRTIFETSFASVKEINSLTKTFSKYGDARDHLKLVEKYYGEDRHPDNYGIMNLASMVKRELDFQDLWMLTKVERDNLGEKVGSFIAKYYEKYPNVIMDDIGENTSHRVYEHEYLIPIFQNIDAMLYCLNLSKESVVRTNEFEKLEHGLSGLLSVWRRNYPLEIKTFDTILSSYGIIYSESTDEEGNKIINWKGIDGDRNRLRNNMLKIRNQLVYSSYDEYRQKAVLIAMRKISKDKLYSLNSNDVMDLASLITPMTNLRRVSEGELKGATEVNEMLGWLRVLEFLAEKYGAEGVPSTLRFSGHYSKLISSSIDSLKAIIGLLGTFDSAGGAKGTVNIFSQFNNIFNHKIIFTQPRQVTKVILDMIKNNDSLYSEMANYINNMRYTGTNKSEEKKYSQRRIIAHELIHANPNDYFRTADQPNREDFVRIADWNGGHDMVSRLQRGRKKTRALTSVLTRSTENEKGTMFLEVFEQFMQAHEIKSGEDQQTYFEADVRVQEAKLSEEHLKRWNKRGIGDVQQWANKFPDSYREVWARQLDLRIATFEMNLAAVALYFRVLAMGPVYSGRTMTQVTKEFELMDTWFKAKDKVVASERIYNATLASVGRVEIV